MDRDRVETGPDRRDIDYAPMAALLDGGLSDAGFTTSNRGSAAFPFSNVPQLGSNSRAASAGIEPGAGPLSAASLLHRVAVRILWAVRGVGFGISFLLHPSDCRSARAATQCPLS